MNGRQSLPSTFRNQGAPSRPSFPPPRLSFPPPHLSFPLPPSVIPDVFNRESRILPRPGHTNEGTKEKDMDSR